jgi:DNA (cytosine-5)-methyltransferase 1
MPSYLKPRALEFFAGGGLARLGLAAQFDVVWANDNDSKKAQAWCANFGEKDFVLGDVHDVDPNHVPAADVAWVSFPCQDLSLAGDRAGLAAKRSGSFFGFVDVIKGLQGQRRAPKVLVIENVSGLLTSRGGQDFAALMQVLFEMGYRAGALEIDARFFVPQSRPRVFVIACAREHSIAGDLLGDGLESSPFITPAIVKAWQALPDTLRTQHIFWALPAPPKAALKLADIIDLIDQNWWSQEKMDALVESFSVRHRAKLVDVQATGDLHIGAIYRRTRRKEGISRPFAEVRFDELAGCLRTPSGGSSRQFLLFVKGQDVAARPLNPREAMRLMGVGDDYILPKSASAGLKIAGDGVVVPVVAWLSKRLLKPLVGHQS